eukprot:scaffold2195_cov119-Phaeocystis_antarctica.AAC.2
MHAALASSRGGAPASLRQNAGLDHAGRLVRACGQRQPHASRCLTTEVERTGGGCASLRERRREQRRGPPRRGSVRRRLHIQHRRRWPMPGVLATCWQCAGFGVRL